MTQEAVYFSGELKYQGYTWGFSFNGNILRLYPSSFKKQEITEQWIMVNIMDRQDRFTKLPRIEDTFLVGFCYEKSQSIVFLTKQGSIIGNVQGYYLTVKVKAYIIIKDEEVKISRISFSSSEINCIHPVINAFDYHFDYDAFSNDGIITLTTRDYKSTTTDTQTFEVDNVTVRAYFGVTRGVSKKIGNPPFLLSSSLIFEFDPTSDYAFVLKLWDIAKRFIQFLCYRKNTFLPTADLSSLRENGKYFLCATLYVLDETGETELLAIKRNKCIKQSYIAGCEGKILSDIASNKLYMRHIPESYHLSHNVDEARFVMITAAFESEFERFYPDGIAMCEEDIEVQQAAKDKIQFLYDSAVKEGNSKLAKHYKRLIKTYDHIPLPPRFKQASEDFDPVIGQHLNNLYKCNGITNKPKYKDMGFDLALERDYLAHGNLKNDYKIKSALPLIYLEYLIYSIQLKLFGAEDKSIQNAICDLFSD